MTLTFWKTTCLGNTFLHLLEEGVDLPAPPEAMARSLCHAGYGAGADGLTLTRPLPGGLVSFIIINRDGSRAEISGNGMAGAAAVRFLSCPGLESLTFETAVGTRTIRILERTAPTSFRLAVDLGVPQIDPPSPTPGKAPLFLSVGNPQAVFRATDPSQVPSTEEQERIHQHLVQAHNLNRGINLAWCAPESPGTVCARFWERGAGPTPASGTGAAAVHAALRHWGLAGEHLLIKSPGGQVSTWFEENRITLENHCSVLYKGVWLCADADTLLPSSSHGD